MTRGLEQGLPRGPSVLPQSLCGDPAAPSGLQPLACPENLCPSGLVKFVKCRSRGARLFMGDDGKFMLKVEGTPDPELCPSLPHG